MDDNANKPRWEWKLQSSWAYATWSISEALIVLLGAFCLSWLPLFFSAAAGSTLGLSLISYLLQDACFFLLPLLIVTAGHKLPEATLGIIRPRWPRLLLIGGGGGVLLYALNVGFSALSVAILPESWQSEQSVIGLFDLADNSVELAILVLFVVGVSPLAEEMLFRAFLLPPLINKYGRRSAYAVAAGIFASIHLNVVVFLPLFVGGLGFCYLYDRYRNLWYNVFAHAVWNALAVTLFFMFG